METENTMHVLFNCSFAQSCWDKVGDNKNVNSRASFLNWMANVFDGWGVDRRQMGAMLCRSIWKCRNDLVWSQKGAEVVDVVESARVVLSQWQNAQDKSFNQSWGLMNPDDGDEHWTTPTKNKTKVNTDAAIFHASHCYSFVFVARNQKGELIEARSSCKTGHISPECAEAMGIREALSWIKGKRLAEVILETDCLVAVQAIIGTATLLSYFGRIIQDCRTLLSELKDERVTLRFVKRSANCSYSIADRIWRANKAHPELDCVLASDLKK